MILVVPKLANNLSSIFSLSTFINYPGQICKFNSHVANNSLGLRSYECVNNQIQIFLIISEIFRKSYKDQNTGILLYSTFYFRFLYKEDTSVIKPYDADVTLLWVQFIHIINTIKMINILKSYAQKFGGFNLSFGIQARQTNNV